MTVYALVNGALFRDPEQRVSKAGKPFWAATLKCRDGDATQWVKICVFSETVGAELMRLSAGDAVSVQGALRVETYEKDGATKIALSLIADHILALRQPPRQKAAGEQKQAQRYQRRPAPGKPTSERRSGFHGTDAPRHHGCNGDDPFGDTVPF